jgi:hypothetical protein
MMNKKIAYTIFITGGLLILSVFLILPEFRIDPFSNCGVYDNKGDLHSTCVCYGVRTRVDNFSRCWGLKFNYYE